MHIATVASLTVLAGTAAALSFTHQPQPARAAAPAVAAPAATRLPSRIPVTPAQVREAYAAGLIDHPIKSILDVRQPMEYGEFRWDERGVPRGPTWIRIDLKSQLISVFRAGHEIGTAVILYGTDGYPTPTGKFPILAKLRNHRSVTYDNAPMPYTLRLRNDGVSIHGSNVRYGFASHGCIGVPKAFAAKLFEVVHTGDEVLIVSGKARSKAS
ncbi:MAG TPA: L,D-transpeptidase family protein [Sphingomicrobium sp.]|nr:L,D-transpeptidase family protein [Sphingomicrobium sp.]